MDPEPRIAPLDLHLDLELATALALEVNIHRDLLVGVEIGQGQEEIEEVTGDIAIIGRGEYLFENDVYSGLIPMRKGASKKPYAHGERKRIHKGKVNFTARAETH